MADAQRATQLGLRERAAVGEHVALHRGRRRGHAPRGAQLAPGVGERAADLLGTR